jgi:DNA-binding GntR family transcriptional regulator
VVYDGRATGHEDRRMTTVQEAIAIGSGSRRVRRHSFVDAAYGEIKRRILGNEFPAGFQILEQDLSELLGMSRTPVHEAMVRLEKEGLVEVIPRHGMRVLPISTDDMREILEVLTGLEAAAAAAVAQRGLSSTQLESLESACRAMEKAVERDDRETWADADQRFHGLLVELSGNRRLSAMVNTFREQSHRVRLITLKLRFNFEESTADHRRLVEAIKLRDAEAARNLHFAHRTRAAERTLDLLDRHGLKHL